MSPLCDTQSSKDEAVRLRFTEDVAVSILPLEQELEEI